ncbi:unnamed protein product [Didymodactylos carnosus]|uniref:Uncharacterized protein n=1 Tax=Didymodactylos carnosus TaxID=1234261 RepID=A0A814ULL6_9BILA|nr:unnamed protein product [Didymodactylos carnosus]CAF1178817.1 unnamed protein product [Didymodactylos carnosus]CAF3812560.1 unnamed protein product [Didymodactylos carnosus]CAF3943026.1 unnamed protein product [Didymodactylos carnosus]
MCHHASSSSGYSSPTLPDNDDHKTIIYTYIIVQLTGFNIRKEFCGPQDIRLNHLRQMTSSIIDVRCMNSGTNIDFQKVEWTIMHTDANVRRFVAKRIEKWAQNCQVACDIYHEDFLFAQRFNRQQMVQSFGQAVLPRSTIAVPPPSSAKTQQFGRSRTRSFSEALRPASFSAKKLIPERLNTPQNKPVHPSSNSLLARTIAGNRIQFEQIPSSQNDVCNIQPSMLANASLETSKMTDPSLADVYETAKWQGQMSDGTDDEDNNYPVPFETLVAVAKLCERLKDHKVQLHDNCEIIDSVFQMDEPVNIKHDQRTKQMDGTDYCFYRLILNDHILFPTSVSRSVTQAKILAYKKMIDICYNSNGIRLKSLTNNRCKVTKHPGKLFQRDTDLNASYITQVDISTLSQDK